MRGLFAEGFAGLEQLLLQFEDAAPGADADAQFMGVEGLGEVIVGAGVHAFDQVLGFGAGGEQEDVDVRFAIGAANFPADFDAIHAGHHPIEHSETGRAGAVENRPSLIAVACDHGLVAPSGQHGFQHGLKHRIVFRGQHAHGVMRLLERVKLRDVADGDRQMSAPRILIG